MARFDVHASPDGPGYLLDLQSDLLDGLTTRVVAPLMPIDAAPAPAAILNPVFEIDGERHVLVTQFLSAVPTKIFRQPVASLADQAETVTRAVDFLLQGF